MKTPQLYWNSLRVLVALVLVIGIFFRFYHLDQKIYWIDEVHTSLRVAGYRKSNFNQQLPTGETLSIAQLHEFQTLSPERGWGDTLNALAENAEHAPIYYLLTRLWMELFGNSITVTRSVAAISSLLAFPAIYFLSLELFSAPMVGWIALSLVAVSPLHLLYAQEARQYSLWTVVTLVSGLALLRSLRLQTRMSWAIYAGTVVLGFYSHLISGLVFFGHGLYVGFREKCKWTKSFKSYLIASGIGCAALIPWIVVYFNNNSRLGGWLERDLPPQALVKRWAINLASVFFDLHIVYPQRFFDVELGQDSLPFAWGNLWGYVVIPIILFVGYALWVTIRKTPKSIGWFLLTSIAANALFLMLYDVISGGQRSGIARYLFPSYLALQLAVAYLFADRLRLDGGRNLQGRFWQVAYVVLLGAGIVSGAVSASAETWWHKYSCYYDVEVAQLVNQAENPQVIGSPDRLSRLIALSYKLNPDVRFLLLPNSDRLEITEPTSSSLFLFRPSENLYKTIESDPRYTLTPIHPLGHIWTVEPISTPTNESVMN